MSGFEHNPTCKVSGDLVFGGSQFAHLPPSPTSSRARHIGAVFLRRALNYLSDSTNAVGSDSSDADSSPPSPSLSALKETQFHPGLIPQPDRYDNVLNKPRVRKFIHRKVVETVCFSRDGRMLATGSKDKHVRIFDVVTGHEILKTKEFGSVVKP